MITSEFIEPTGSAFAVKRFRAYRGTVVWKHHSDYFGQEICRAYHLDTGKPCALYACELYHPGYEGVALLVGENLDMIRREVKKVVG